MKQSELYTGQILDLKVEGNRNCGRLNKCWLDAIRGDLNFQAETSKNRREWRKRLKTASHAHIRGVI